MAFKKNKATDVAADDSWKADGFINLYLPGKGGSRKKLGAIPLKDSKPSEKSLRAWLEENPKHIEVLLSKLEVEYHTVDNSENNGFDLA